MDLKCTETPPAALNAIAAALLATLGITMMIPVLASGSQVKQHLAQVKQHLQPDLKYRVGKTIDTIAPDGTMRFSEP